MKTGVLKRGECRFLGSLYHSTFPELTYNTNNTEILAPWITLSTQEVLLDLSLSSYTVVEYGSGMSTFFFAKKPGNAIHLKMIKTRLAKVLRPRQCKPRQVGSINLISPELYNDLPELVVRDLWKGNGNLLVSIDGGDRCKHLKDWANYIDSNQ